MKDYLELPSIQTPSRYFDELEKRLKKHFKEMIYFPLLRELDLSKKILTNAKKIQSNPLIDALFTAKITYRDGIFSGQFSAGTSKALKELGAQFDKKASIFKLRFASLPQEIKNVILSSDRRFQEKMASLDRTIQKILPEEIADSFKSEDIFDRALWKADTEFKENVKKVMTPAQLTETQRKKIAAEWQNNMKLWVKDFTRTEIQDLRVKVMESAFQGNRYGSLIQTIQSSYGVSADKAKFLARQETHLLMSKFKEVRYTVSGIHEYVWKCVHRPHDSNPKKHTPGNVRYSHGILEGKIFRFDSPPVTSNPGEAVRRNNPGEDYNCRCVARGIMRLKKT